MTRLPPAIFSSLFSFPLPAFHPSFPRILRRNAETKGRQWGKGREVGENWSGAPSKSRKLSCRLPDALRIFPENNFRHSGWRREGLRPVLEKFEGRNSRLVRDLKSGTSLPFPDPPLEIVNSTIMTILITIRKGENFVVSLRERGGRRVGSLFTRAKPI